MAGQPSGTIGSPVSVRQGWPSTQNMANVSVREPGSTARLAKCTKHGPGSAPSFRHGKHCFLKHESSGPT
jgi:hypothetical protein